MIVVVIIVLLTVVIAVVSATVYTNKEKEKDLFLRHARFFKAMKKFRMPSLHGKPH